PFNAEAVEFNYMRYLDKNHPYYDANAIQRAQLLPGVKSVKAKDEYTVEFLRETPSFGYTALLAHRGGGIMSPTAIKKYGVKDAGRYPVGTGPFVFEKAEKGNQASMKAFDEYWGGRPLLDRVVVRQIADEQAMTASLLSGEVDITSFVDYKELEAFRKNPNLKVQTAPAAATGYMGVNQQHQTMKDVRVRRALAHAVNKQKIVDVIFYGEGDVGAGLISTPMSAYAPQFKDYYKHDPQKAKDLLKQAGGAPDLLLYTQNQGFWPRMAELMQADFSAVGLKTTIEKVDTAKFLGLMTEGKHQAFIGDATYNVPDPDEILWGFYGCENPRAKRWGYCDKTFDDRMAKQAAEKDQEKRKQMLWEIQKTLLDEVATEPLYYPRSVTVANKRVEGYVPMPIRYMFLDETSVVKR
ncbi:MAG: ABC transporter substrate-binding protein, partial [Chloroflexi bacterium]|nr:ABC transporter substrate-binding protein [Chloroflexota bacterium]